MCVNAGAGFRPTLWRQPRSRNWQQFSKLKSEQLRLRIIIYSATGTIKILSNSQAAIKAVKAVKTALKIVADCRIILNWLVNNYPVKIIWIFGHCDFN